GGMILDIGSRRNLELTETVRDKSKKGSLLWVLDSTKTSMGARLLRSRLEQPLTDKITIEKRLDGVELMKNDLQKRTELRENLKQIYDIERIMGKLVYGSAHGRDMAALRASLSFMPKLREILSGFDCAFIQDILSNWDDLTDVYTLLCDSIAEEPPLGIKDVGVIKTGYDPELDKLREAMEKGTGWLMEMEASEREKTGIKNLKIRFNKVHGYYIEVSNSYLNQVPDTYIRRQTLTTGERFINPELKELEETLLTAEDRLTTLEAEIFAKIKQKTADEYSRVMQQAALVSEADFIQSLAETADNCNYAKPVITNENIIKITNGRHPVVERQDGCQYIPNDTDIDKNTNTVSIITGPNMAGKSTYMRQTALIVLMAQIGSFVPADAAEIGITDRIFTRVGASDDLATGQSTFMVEMVEVANILNNATENSLLILDELGRGTSTFDGMSIAWAVIEHIAKKIKARTLFSTHYQELTALSDRLENVKNYCVSVMEQGEDVIFLRKIKEGSADKSYGVHVAKLAGVPKSVVRRANQVLSILCSSGLDVSVNDKGEYVDPEVYNDEKVKKYAEIAEYLEDLDMDEVSPKEAWEKLNTL
ncbi:MAG: DNA mismatch repair protein MutS, partial [Firmicutes bacterium]|nr:DNA mismatch repair protein MutS [Bacillota bacterium]